MSTDWSIDKELQKLANAPSTEAALRALGLLGQDAGEFELISAPEGWFRSGAETYLYRFRLRKEGLDTSLVLKACVAYAPATTLDAVLQAWMDRRQLLASHGVRTPQLYAWGDGVILEEDVPFELKEMLRERSPSMDLLLFSMAETGGAVTSLGFLPVSLFEDLRSHGEDVVMVDFGQDLGPPFVAKDRNPEVFDQLVRYLSKLGMVLQETLKQRLYSVFEAQWHLKSH
jgi:hypothetical protein